VPVPGGRVLFAFLQLSCMQNAQSTRHPRTSATKPLTYRSMIYRVLIPPEQDFGRAAIGNVVEPGPMHDTSAAVRCVARAGSGKACVERSDSTIGLVYVDST
jgi:hypothetical protein